jgi:hypothetical protein
MCAPVAADARLPWLGRHPGRLDRASTLSTGETMTQPYGRQAGPEDPGQPRPVDPYAAPFPTSGQPYPTSGPPDSPPLAAAPPARKRRGALVGAAAALVLLLCVGGGVSAWLLLRNLESGEGAPEPVAAVNTFLEAVYADKDTAKAAGIVCSEARDQGEIAAKVAEVKSYDAKYDSPRFEWDDPKVDEQGEERAVVSVKLRMTTADEKTAEQQLRFTVVRKTGWWVCEVA